MKQILDKFVILFLCCIILWQFNDSYIPVLALLLFTMLSSLRQSYPKSKVSLITIIVAIVLCYFHPIFCCMLPLIIYDILYDEKYILSLLIFFSIFTYMTKLSSHQISLIIFGTVLALLLWYRTSRLLKLEADLITMRDTSEERNLLLKEKNVQLLENQDNNIRLATMKERNRIAREIHDNVGHMLTRSILQVGAMSILNKDESQKESFEHLENTLNCAMTSIRSSVHNLYDDSIDLKLLITDATNELKEKYQLSIEYDCSESLPQTIKLCLLGIIKECVSNVVKHSNGDSVHIILREHPGFYQLLFSDNGSCNEINHSSGIGLNNMQDRVSQVGGVINFTPSASGFTTFVSIPK